MNTRIEPAKTPGRLSGQMTRTNASEMRNEPMTAPIPAPMAVARARAGRLSASMLGVAQAEHQGRGEDAATERAGDGAAAAPRAGVQVTRRLDQPEVDLLEGDVQRQDHERQELVGQPGHDRERRADDAEVGGDEAERVTDERQEDPLVAEDDPPRDGPDEEAREERGDDEEQQEASCSAHRGRRCRRPSDSP